MIFYFFLNLGKQQQPRPWSEIGKSCPLTNTLRTNHNSVFVTVTAEEKIINILALRSLCYNRQSRILCPTRVGGLWVTSSVFRYSASLHFEKHLERKYEQAYMNGIETPISMAAFKVLSQLWLFNTRYVFCKQNRMSELWENIT